MSSIVKFPNAVTSVAKAPLLVVLIPRDQSSWCQQFSEEGYTVIQVPHSNQEGDDLRQSLAEAGEELHDAEGWALLTYGITPADLPSVKRFCASAEPKACVHFCPAVESPDSIVHEALDGAPTPALFHLSSKQELLHYSLEQLAETKSAGIATSRYPPIAVYAYPLVSPSPPFPFLAGPPIDHASGKVGTIDPHLRSANNLAYTRTLELLRRELGPRFPLEKLWEKHTYYVRVLRGNTQSSQVTPPDTELITISRTVGADRIIDEMIFKCTHTTEIDYFLPGIKPTGKPLEIALVGVVAFRGDKLTFEYWDQASLLVQLGLLNPKGLPVAGVEVARKVVDPFGLPSNTLMSKWKESEGLPID
ncbi:hypothetical protein BN946_scf185013.g123 [Trametes cinnabarina]|uniref:SnoaL-like domain-containing protein n=1 Tax=Pycnoporus cinnabarinus TaxID=5643 RepID=A0A060SM43_PYCCI|nr:hypothetical protein BN946_scf185013.g123 [Trametes cinnabarina]